MLYDNVLYDNALHGNVLHGNVLRAADGGLSVAIWFLGLARGHTRQRGMRSAPFGSGLAEDH